MSTAKSVSGQGRDFYIAELYQAAFMLDISDGACRVLMALLHNIDTDSRSSKFQTTWTGQDWIAFHIGKDVRNVRRIIDELIAVDLINVVHSGRNKTNVTRVNTNLLLELGRARHGQAVAQLEALRNSKKERTDKKLHAKLAKTDRAKSSGPGRAKSSGPDRIESPGDLISASHEKDLMSTVATPSASQPSCATGLASGSRTHDSTTETATTNAPIIPQPQGSRGFNDDQIGAWEALEVTIQSKLEALRLDGQTTNERINVIHQSLMSRRYTIGSELFTAYEQGLTETHEAQIVSEWIMKVALAPTSDPRRYVTTMIAFIRGRVELIARSSATPLKY